MLQFLKRQPGNGVVFRIVVNRETQKLRELVNRHPARDEIRTIRPAHDSLFLDMVLLHGADDRFHHVARSNHTFKMTVLVIDKHHMRWRAANGFHHVERIGKVRHDRNITDDLAQIDTAPGGQLIEEVAHL